jgi:glycine dehydrogenase
MALPKDFTFTDYDPYNFADRRHIGPSPAEMDAMLKVVGYKSLDALIDDTVPSSIRLKTPLKWDKALTEREALDKMRETANKNQKLVSLIGQGYYGTITPPVIQRTILENPAWYTAYTPYQPEISQGRLEALINYQTMVSDLTGLDIANASLLDESTAAAEAMAMAQRVAKSKSPTKTATRRILRCSRPVPNRSAGMSWWEIPSATSTPTTSSARSSSIPAPMATFAISRR